jgi:hypothetical protein
VTSHWHWGKSTRRAVITSDSLGQMYLSRDEKAIINFWNCERFLRIRPTEPSSQTCLQFRQSRAIACDALAQAISSNNGRNNHFESDLLWPRRQKTHIALKRWQDVKWSEEESTLIFRVVGSRSCEILELSFRVGVGGGWRIAMDEKPGAMRWWSDSPLIFYFFVHYSSISSLRSENQH